MAGADPRQVFVKAVRDSAAEIQATCNTLRSQAGSPAATADGVHQLDQLVAKLKVLADDLAHVSPSGQGRVPAGPAELSRAAQDHSDAAGEHASASAYLLLFYAAECSLKSVSLLRNRKNRLEQLPVEYQGLVRDRGHDLGEWAKRLRILPQRLPDWKAFHAARNRRDSWPPDRVHQAWRYGVQVDPVDEQRLVKLLREFRTLLREEERRR